ncbi:hypothetical protein GOBAR_DD12579 [Gossypium barbadense]|nr:hypothetical protein GOBAR_DD12579 [Gossypium barbadense]
MEEIFQTISWEEPHPSQKLPCESCSDADEDVIKSEGFFSQNWRSASPSLQPWDGSFLYPDWAQSHNQPGISSGVVPNQISNHSPSLKELTNNHSILKRNLSSVSGSERALRKKRIDQAYRERCKVSLSSHLISFLLLENEKLKDENASLRKNANPNCNLPQLAEENAKLRIENKVLKVQNDALCGKIISDDDKKHEQEQ